MLQELEQMVSSKDNPQNKGMGKVVSIKGGDRGEGQFERSAALGEAEADKSQKKRRKRHRGKSVATIVGPDGEVKKVKKGPTKITF